MKSKKHVRASISPDANAGRSRRSESPKRSPGQLGRSTWTGPGLDLDDPPPVIPPPPPPLNDLRPVIDPPSSPSSTRLETENFDAVEEIPVAPLDPPPAMPATVDEVQAAVMSEEKFAEFFGSLFPVTAYGISLVNPDLGPPLQSLVMAPTIPEFPPASGAIYRMAQIYPWLRWLLDPASIWMRDLAVLSAFGGKVGSAVYGELTERERARKDRLRHPRKPEPPASEAAP
jgi:hypothetical protein